MSGPHPYAALSGGLPWMTQWQMANLAALDLQGLRRVLDREDRVAEPLLSQNDFRVSSAWPLRDNRRGLFFTRFDCSLHGSTKRFVHFF